MFRLESCYSINRFPCYVLWTIACHCVVCPSIMASDYRFGIFKLFFRVFNYRLMHALFHIKTVIIPRDQYQPEGFSQRVDIGRGMITVLIWKKECIHLFITYFNIELKRTNLTSHTDTKLMDMSDRYRLRLLLPKRQQIFPC